MMTHKAHLGPFSHRRAGRTCNETDRSTGSVTGAPPPGAAGNAQGRKFDAWVIDGQQAGTLGRRGYRESGSRILADRFPRITAPACGLLPVDDPASNLRPVGRFQPLQARRSGHEPVLDPFRDTGPAARTM